MPRTTHAVAFALGASLLASCSQSPSVSPIPGTDAPTVAAPQSVAAPQAVAARQSVAASTDATVAFPPDYPTAARTGSTQRFAPRAGDVSLAAPKISLSGPGATHAKSFAYRRSDGSYVVAIYVPTGTPLASGYLGIGFGENVRVPIVSTYADSGAWSDNAIATSPLATLYETQARVLLVDTIGTGAVVAPTPTAKPSAGPTAKPTVRPTTGPTSKPTAKPTTKPTPAPKPTVAPTAYPTGYPYVSGVSWPAPGSYAFFPKSPMRVALRDPKPAANDATWKAANGGLSIDALRVESSVTGYAYDPSEPIEYVDSSAGTRYVAHCVDYTCPKDEGDVVYIQSRAQPQGILDGHLTTIDTRAGVEHDIFQADVRGARNPAGGTLNVGFIGSCSLAGDGTNCGGTASGVAIGIGMIKPEDLLAGGRTLPYAIQGALRCESHAYVYPAVGSDGGTASCPPAGTRVYLDYTDAQIDATSNPESAKKIWRTIDREHYGAVLTDTDPYAGGIFLQEESALTYTSYGAHDFWNDVASLWQQSAYNGILNLNVPSAGLSIASHMHFAAP